MRLYLQLGAAFTILLTLVDVVQVWGDQGFQADEIVWAPSGWTMLWMAVGWL